MYAIPYWFFDMAAKKKVAKKAAKKIVVRSIKGHLAGAKTLTKQVVPDRSNIEHRWGPWEYVEIVSLFGGKCRCKVSCKHYTRENDVWHCEDSVSVWHNGKWSEVYSPVTLFPFKEEPARPDIPSFSSHEEAEKIRSRHYDARAKFVAARFQNTRDELLKVAIKLLQSEYK